MATAKTPAKKTTGKLTVKAKEEGNKILKRFVRPKT